MNRSPDLRPVVVNSNDGTVSSGRPGWVILYMCPSAPPLDRYWLACCTIQSGRFGASLASVMFCTPSVMGDPWAVQGLLDAAVAGLDHIGGDGADKSIKRLGADRV